MFTRLGSTGARPTEERAGLSGALDKGRLEPPERLIVDGPEWAYGKNISRLWSSMVSLVAAAANGAGGGMAAAAPK